jgi:hypothetical protein
VTVAIGEFGLDLSPIDPLFFARLDEELYLIIYFMGFFLVIPNLSGWLGASCLEMKYAV